MAPEAAVSATIRIGTVPAIWRTWWGMILYFSAHFRNCSLNDRIAGDEITGEKAEKAATEGLVVMFGCSDDLMELRGATDEDISCFNGSIQRR